MICFGNFTWISLLFSVMMSQYMSIAGCEQFAINDVSSTVSVTDVIENQLPRQSRLRYKQDLTIVAETKSQNFSKYMKLDSEDLKYHPHLDVSNRRQLRMPYRLYDYWICPIKPWEVDYNDTHMIESQKMIQDFLYAWNHNPTRCKNNLVNNQGYENGGIGMNYFSSLAWLAESLERGLLFQPKPNFFWALHYDNCTLNATRIDCFTEPISTCGMESHVIEVNNQNLVDEFDTTLGKMLWQTRPNGIVTIDSCNIAIALKKSLAWVAGQYLKYLLRIRTDIQQKLNDIKRGVFDDIDRSKFSVAAVHLRGGKPDWGRRVQPLETYMEALAKKAIELQEDGRPLSRVYLVSVDNQAYFHNVSYLNERFPANYTYKIMTMQATSNLTDEVEIELRSLPTRPRWPFMFEFQADMDLMVDADLFLGSVSNIYLVATFLRYTKLNAWKNKRFNCYISDWGNLLCEDDPEKIEIYRKYFIHGDKPFKEGTPF